MKQRHSKTLYTEVDISYRASYGKLFSRLLFQYGAVHLTEIEDAIQNAFYKSLKTWKPDQLPKNKESWLYIVARNDLINQLKRSAKLLDGLPYKLMNSSEDLETEDLRLKTILLIANLINVSPLSKVLFILKNVFGLSVREISECTLIGKDAIYKNISRSKKLFYSGVIEQMLENVAGATDSLAIVEEILYAVFSIGFDSFDEKIESIINDDLCLEALAITKLLYEKNGKNSTRNLMSLFCFHIARLPEKLVGNKLVPFGMQDAGKWNNDFISLGFHYLNEPNYLSKYYVEAIVISKHMTTTTMGEAYWNQIIELYELLFNFTDSPIVKINFCFCLHKADRTEEAVLLLDSIEKELPVDHLYFSIVKADILKNTTVDTSRQIINRMLDNVSQEVRKQHLSEYYKEVL